jgi:hypothetical protein
MEGEQILRVSENRVLKRIFGPEMEEVAGGWGILHNEELHNLQTSPKSRTRWAGHVVRKETPDRKGTSPKT